MNNSRMGKHDWKEHLLAKHLGVDVETIDNVYGDVYSSTEAVGEYLVLTEEEADEAWDESLQSDLDDCILCELPDIAKNYFDEEKWKRDAKIDGRGHSLATYDGTEHEFKVDDEWVYIYRVG